MTIQDLLNEVERLPVSDKWRLVNYLLHSLEEAQRQDQPDDWHQALRATYGILADDPIECPEPLPLEERDLLK